MTAILSFISLPSSTTATNTDYQLYVTATGRPVAAQELGQLIAGYDVVIFGEYHGQSVLHRLELELLRQAYRSHSNVAVSLEMIERDAQDVLDDYLAGRSDEARFLDRSRPWKTYSRDYRPLVEFARHRGLKVIAANIPRPAAAQYAKEGNFEAIEMPWQPYLPEKHWVLDGEYRRRFVEYMTSMDSGNGTSLSPARIDAYYRAQCLKDDTMAESILIHHRRYPTDKILHYQGDFHSRYRLGVVEKLRMLDANLRILVFTPVVVAEYIDLKEKSMDYQADGDVAVFLMQAPPSEE